MFALITQDVIVFVLYLALEKTSTRRGNKKLESLSFFFAHCLSIQFVKLLLVVI